MTIEKLDNRVEELKAANAVDQEELSKAEKDYEEAVYNFESDKIDSLHSRIVAIKSTLENRIKQITLLVSPDNPIRLEAKAKQFKKAEDDLNAAKAKADAVHEKILKAQADYIELANEIFEANEEYRLADSAFHKANGTQMPSGPYLKPMKYGVTLGTDRYNRTTYFQGGIYK